MKTTAKIILSVFFIILMVGGAYAWDDASSGGNPPIWQIFKKWQAVHWVDWQNNQRFAIYNHGTPNDPVDDMVLDKETGLVWERSPNTSPRNWYDAQTYCNALTKGGRFGWRLPTLQELTSLIDPSVPAPGPSLPPGHPFSNVQTYYWSATSRALSLGGAWVVGFSLAGVGLDDYTRVPYFNWCVRGGQGVDPQ